MKKLDAFQKAEISMAESYVIEKEGSYRFIWHCDHYETVPKALKYAGIMCLDGTFKKGFIDDEYLHLLFEAEQIDGIDLKDVDCLSDNRWMNIKPINITLAIETEFNALNPNLENGFNIRVTKDMIHNALYDICDRVHSHCNSDCPVYAINNQVPDTANDFKVNRGCDCFKSGAAMIKYIKENG